MFKRDNTFFQLTQKSSLKQKLIAIHSYVKETFPFIVRVSVAVYDPQTKILKTFLHSSGDENPLSNYQSLLEESPSLLSISKSGKSRVINDMSEIHESTLEHSIKISNQNYGASYTVPIYNEGSFSGFIFFDSSDMKVFNERMLRDIDLYAQLISFMIIKELTSIGTLNAAVKTTGNISHVRDPETGKHLERMSRYTRIIAKSLAEKYNLDDEYIEHLFLFSPLHDIGKVGIPDSILLKPGPLSKEELATMRSHSTLGFQMIDDLLENFGLANFGNTDMLRNIVLYHHETLDGKGYPNGLKGSDIPLEAKIIAVADIFDALTSVRPYKEAWSNEKTINHLIELTNEKLDKDCVDALVQNMDEVVEIQNLFSEETLY